MSKLVNRMILASLLFAAFTAQASAAVPVYITIYMEKSFVNEFGSQATSTANRIFNDTARYYQDKWGLELRLNRIDQPFWVTDGASGESPDVKGSLLNLMRTQLPPGGTGWPNNGVEARWLLVHRDIGLQGRVDHISALGGAWSNLLVNTQDRGRGIGSWATGDPRQGGGSGTCAAVPAHRRASSQMRDTAIHEMAHLLSAVHPSAAACAIRNSPMCVPGPATCTSTGWVESRAPGGSMDPDNAASMTRFISHSLSGLPNP